MAFPELFEKRLKIFGDQSAKILAALKGNPILSIRLNSNKFQKTLNLSKVQWCDNAYYLKSRPLFAADPLWHSGHYYVQEASSMFIACILKAINLENPVMLDACAAPGGKSTLLQEFLGTSGLLVSNEVIQSRVGVLSENLTKWGNHRRVIVSNDTSQFKTLPETFDVVLVDAPCSGEGMFRKDKNASQYWDENLVNLCAARQKKISHGLLDSIKEGGYLIYSTCTFNEEENEHVIRDLIETHDFEKVDIEITGLNGITIREEQGNAIYRFLPGISEGEGFTCCVLRKAFKSKVKREKPGRSSLRACSLRLPGVKKHDSILQSKEGNILAFPSARLNLLSKLEAHLNVQSFGHNLYKEIKGKLKPEDELSLWSELDLNLIETRELNYEEAIQVLMKAGIPSSGQKGYQIACFENYPLAVLNDLGNRVNNNFPKSYRLRKRQADTFSVLSYLEDK